MNLADALREACLRIEDTDSSAEGSGLRVEVGGFPYPQPSTLHAESSAPVRLELQLTHEQLAALFRSVLARGQSVMTLKEASALLRLEPPVLQRMAERRELPAFQVEGRWRFPRAGVEEWLAAQITPAVARPAS